MKIQAIQFSLLWQSYFAIKNEFTNKSQQSIELFPIHTKYVVSNPTEILQSRTFPGKDGYNKVQYTAISYSFLFAYFLFYACCRPVIVAERESVQSLHLNKSDFFTELWVLSTAPESSGATAHFVTGNHCSNRLYWQIDLGRMQFHFCYVIKITEYLWNKILKRRDISVKHKTEAKSKLDIVLIKLATSLSLGIFQAWIDTKFFQTVTFLDFFSTGKDSYRGKKGETHFKRMSA